MATPESRIKNKINRVLDKFEGRIYKYMPVPSGFGRRTVDYLVCFDGLFIAIEAKSPNGRTTELQEATLADIRKAGGTTFVIRDDDDVSKLEKFLNSVTEWGITRE